MKFVKAIQRGGYNYERMVLVNLDKVELITRVDNPAQPPIIWIGEESFECLVANDEVYEIDGLSQYIVEI
jgi:hypothetical protein